MGSSMPLPVHLQPPRHHEMRLGPTALHWIGFCITLGMMGVMGIVGVKMRRGENSLKRKKAHPELAEVCKVELQDWSSPQTWSLLIHANWQIKVTPTLALYFLTRSASKSWGNAVTSTEIQVSNNSLHLIIGQRWSGFNCIIEFGGGQVRLQQADFLRRQISVSGKCKSLIWVQALELLEGRVGTSYRVQTILAAHHNLEHFVELHEFNQRYLHLCKRPLQARQGRVLSSEMEIVFMVIYL